MICERRTAYFATYPDQARRNGLPSGPLPHAYGSRVRTQVDGEWGEWSPAKCSWCGAVKP